VNPLEVTHVVGYYPPHLGGMEKVVEVLAGLQSESGVAAQVMTSNEGGDGHYVDPYPGLAVLRLRAFSVAHTPVIPGLFFKLLRLNRTAIVHLHVAQAFAPEAVLLAAGIRRFPYIAHVHLDVEPSGPAGFLLKIYKPFALKLVLRRANLVVVFTEEQRQKMHNQYNVDLRKIEVMPNGVEAKFFSDETRSLHARPRLLFVGRLGIQKNLPLLLRALDGVSEQFETTIVGDGELEGEIKRLATDLRLQNVTFAGRAAGERLLEYYRQADVFVLPSEREGMPLVLLEAMAMGLPIVATDVMGNRDVIVHNANGLLVPYNDTAAFRSALLEIVADQDTYEKLSRTSRAMADEYTWESVVARFKGLYERVLAGGA
jgi:glycosyltransferase involved in cell wall biosynthesis